MRSTFVSRHQDMRGLLEVLAKEVSKGVVFLQQNEIRGIGSTLSFLASETQLEKC